MRIGILSIMCRDFSISLGPQKKSLLISLYKKALKLQILNEVAATHTGGEKKG